MRVFSIGNVRVVLLIVLALAACSYLPASVPASVIVADRVPAAWAPTSANASGDPTIVGVRLSSLSPRVGTVWTGDVVTSTDVAAVALHTDLYDIAATREGRGRFAFRENLIDLPAFLVRPYRLSLIARATNGRSTTLLIPFRIRPGA